MHPPRGAGRVGTPAMLARVQRSVVKHAVERARTVTLRERARKCADVRHKHASRGFWKSLFASEISDDLAKFFAKSYGGETLQMANNLEALLRVDTRRYVFLDTEQTQFVAKWGVE